MRSYLEQETYLQMSCKRMINSNSMAGTEGEISTHFQNPFINPFPKSEKLFLIVDGIGERKPQSVTDILVVKYKYQHKLYWQNSCDARQTNFSFFVLFLKIGFCVKFSHE